MKFQTIIYLILTTQQRKIQKNNYFVIHYDAIIY